MLQRLARYDVARRFESGWKRTLLQVAFGAGCALVMILLRAVVDLWVPTSGPYSMIFPTIMFATLYGRWPAGLVAWIICFFWAWWAILPVTSSFEFSNPNDLPRTILNATSAALVLVFAEVFRSAVERATRERDDEIDRREMAMLELGHRTKNNFALVASLLEIQKRREVDPKIGQTLDTAIGRVQSFAEAYEYLQDDGEERGLEVEMRPYLAKLVQMIGGALFDERVRIDLDIADIRLPKEKAVALGLVLNEALTNAAKYAFPDGRRGAVKVRLSDDPSQWEFDVDDDGVGRTQAQIPQGSGIGAGLMEAFARQAHAELKVESLERGTRLRLRSAMV